ncbi:MAG: class I SAM-dependent methyltransferase [Rhizomicrobium sp.]
MLSHSALMDGVYHRQRHLYDFTRKFYLFGRDSLIRELRLHPGERVVEIGCGTARNLIALARRYPGTALYGLDASGEMLRTAEESVNRAGLRGQIRLVKGLAEELSPGLFGEDEPFDRVVFSYSLSMIPPWKQSLEAAVRALKPGGELAVVDFGDFERLPRPFATLMNRWLALFHVSPRVRLLNAIESRPLANGEDLRILPGRYAFVWRGSAHRVQALPD